MNEWKKSPPRRNVHVLCRRYAVLQLKRSNKHGYRFLKALDSVCLRATSYNICSEDRDTPRQRYHHDCLTRREHGAEMHQVWSLLMTSRRFFPSPSISSGEQPGSASYSGPEYEETHAPLASCGGLARRAGMEDVMVKDACCGKTSLKKSGS